MACPLEKFKLRQGAAPCQTRDSFGLSVAVALYLLCESRAGAENHADYKYEVYAEEADRILVRTHSALFEQELAPWMALKGSLVYDGISGATPTGGPPLAGSSQVPLAKIEDIRRAVAVEPILTIGRHTIRPQFAYSIERDYESVVPSLNYLIDFNQRNTTLAFGWAHNFDRLTRGIFLPRPQTKDNTDFLLGMTQVVTPSTLFNVTLTLGTASGYLSDPYKGFRFTQYPDLNALFPDKRPGHRTKQIVSVTLNQHVESLDGSAEFTYRFYHDSFGLFGHTVTLEWFQNVGRYLVVAPLVRYYEQSPADFYLLGFDADPSDPQNPNNALGPKFYSSDYRLSALRTWTCGVSATVKVRQWLSFDLAYKRYEMAGLDGVTAASNYPKANIYTVGLRLHF
jgi:hypothetical protein